MKKIIIAFISLFISLNIMSQTTDYLKSVCQQPAKIYRDGSQLSIQASFDFSQLDVKSEHVILFTPYLSNEEKSVNLKSVAIYGKHRYLYTLRNSEGSMLTGERETSFQTGKQPANYTYIDRITYEPWMNNSQLLIRAEEIACCKEQLAQEVYEAGGYREVVYEPLFVYVSPEIETVKHRSLSGSAYIDYPVSKVVINPSYRNNKLELDKIIATINSVKDDKDVDIESIRIKGFASPEGTYRGNERLAKGRVESLKAYVSKLYPMQKDLIKTEYEPEDWEGLREFVEKSNLEHRSEILELIDSSSAPDEKEREIRHSYPKDYALLLRDCYPALRHSNYVVAYTVRSYTDVEDIKRLVKENPKNLSLQEFYQAAQTYERGSQDFNEVFDTAVRLYPQDAVANLNAANTAMAKGDMALAARYLQRAGEDGYSVYARGVYAALTKNYRQAEELFTKAASAGVKEASEALKSIRELQTIYE